MILRLFSHRIYREKWIVSIGVPGGTPTQNFLGNVNIPVKVYSYAGKVTFKINDNHQVEASIPGHRAHDEDVLTGTC